jgi:PAS domain S-box-containing protein
MSATEVISTQNKAQGAPIRARMRLDSVNRTGLRIFAAAGVLALLLWTAIGFALHEAERGALERADTQASNLARSMAEHVASSVRAIDLVLLHLRDDWVASALPFPDQVVRHQANLKREHVAQVIITDADGKIAYSSLPGFIGIDVSDQPFFKVHKEPGENALQIGAPRLDPALKQLTIKFTRAIHDREHFAGVIGLLIPPPGLARIYEDIDLGAGSSITLVRADGQILARSHDLDKISSVSLANIPGLGPDAPPSGTIRHVARTDAVERLYRYQKVPGYPLTLYVGQSVDTVLAPYRAQRASYLAGGAFATVLLLAVALLLVSRVRDQETARASRDRLEAEMRDRAAHLQLLYETSSAAIFDVDARGVITLANRRMAEMLGLPLEQLIGSKYADYVHPDERTTASAATSSLIEGKTHAIDRERRYRRVDGSEFWGRVTGRRISDAEGRVIGLVSVIVDITEARRAGEALRQNEARLRELFDNFPLAVAHMDKAQRITFANRHYRESYGEDFEGRTVREFVGEQVYAVLEPLIAKALAGETVISEHTIVEATGRRATRALRYIPDRNAAGEVVGFFGLREDITARREAEEQIRKLNEDLERRVLERTNELRAAIAALEAEVREHQQAEAEALSLAQRLHRMSRRLGEAQEAERRRLASELHDGVGSHLAAIGLNLALLQKQLSQGNTANLQRQLADLIALIDQAKANAKEISIDLRPLLLENRDLLPALEEHAHKFGRSFGIAVEVKGESSGDRLPAEKKIALFRIVQEALTNCAKHARASSVAIEFNSHADHLQLSVVDDGVGIDLARMNGMNQGLGLLSMQERAESIGGSWRIESAPGKGTRVSVSLGAAAGHGA